MKEAIGNGWLISIIIVFLFLIMGLLITSLSYSKAYKVKDKIVNVIEKYNGFTSTAQAEVDADLSKMGYRLNKGYTSCPQKDGAELLHNGERGTYHYCVYKYSSERGYYYKVVAYMHYDIPLIGDNFAVPVSGESRTIYQDLEG